MVLLSYKSKGKKMSPVTYAKVGDAVDQVDHHTIKVCMGHDILNNFQFNKYFVSDNHTLWTHGQNKQKKKNMGMGQRPAIYLTRNPWQENLLWHSTYCTKILLSLLPLLTCFNFDVFFLDWVFVCTRMAKKLLDTGKTIMYW